MTDPDIQRDEVISEHVNSTKPTVLISSSLNGVLNKKYRTEKLDDVAQSLLGVGKYSRPVA